MRNCLTSGVPPGVCMSSQLIYLPSLNTLSALWCLLDEVSTKPLVLVVLVSLLKLVTFSDSQYY